MTPEQQRIAIAEACGWKIYKNGVSRPHESFIIYADEREGIHALVPNYPADLNAMHEAEELFERGESLEAFSENLAVVVFGECPDALLRYSDAARLAHATAAQRAEAFLRTIGKWEDGK